MMQPDSALRQTANANSSSFVSNDAAQMGQRHHVVQLQGCCCNSPAANSGMWVSGFLAVHTRNQPVCTLQCWSHVWDHRILLCAAQFAPMKMLIGESFGGHNVRSSLRATPEGLVLSWTSELIAIEALL